MVDWLREGTFRPGSKLPSQNELVERLGVSRTGLREALQAMAALNLIEIRPGLGCFVKKVSAEYIVNADVLAILLEKEAILEVVEARKILEAGIAALAVERATERDFWLMEDSLNHIEKAIERGESVARLTPEFHYAIAKATRNCVLEKLVRSFSQLMTTGGELLESSAENLADFRQHELQSHRLLYEVIRKGDPQKAARAIVDHIEYSQALMVDAFRQAEGGDESL
jgi:DNA-binding FadR family transcriptional regulator